MHSRTPPQFPQTGYYVSFVSFLKCSNSIRTTVAEVLSVTQESAFCRNFSCSGTCHAGTSLINTHMEGSIPLKCVYKATVPTVVPHSLFLFWRALLYLQPKKPGGTIGMNRLVSSWRFLQNSDIICFLKKL